MSDSPPRDDRRGLDRLIQAIVDDPGYSRGLRKSERGLTVDEALEVLVAFYEAHDTADQQIPRIAESLGCTIACAIGCSACCGSLVLVSKPEARLLARELLRPEHDAARERVLSRAREWAARAGERATRAAEALAAGNNTRYLRLMKEHAHLRLSCPLLTDDRCAVYEARPLPCRQQWAANTNAYCMPSDDPDQPEAQLITFDAFEALIAQGRALTAGMQHVMGDGIRRQPLAIALLGLLDDNR